MKEIFTRRSVRTYLDKPVEPEKIETLLRAAMQAPTAVNQQAWEFVVVTERDIIDRLADVSPYAGMLKKAPLAIVPVGNLETAKVPAMWQQDVSAAIENILLEAVHLELGAVWLGIYPAEDRVQGVADILGLPDHVKTLGILSIGYPKDPYTEAPSRYDPAKVHYNKY